MADRKKDDSTGGSDGGVSVIEKKSVSTIEPRMFKVLLLNDDYTSMDFVVDILETIFNKAPAEAVQIMMRIHKEGQGLCGIYPREIAETKVRQVHITAETHDYPLRAIMEEV